MISMEGIKHAVHAWVQGVLEAVNFFLREACYVATDPSVFF